METPSIVPRDPPAVRRLALGALVVLCAGWLVWALTLTWVVSKGPRIAGVFDTDDALVARGVIHMITDRTFDYRITAYPGFYFNVSAVLAYAVSLLGVPLHHAAMLATRWVSATCGAATIALTGVLAWRLSGRWIAGLVAAAILATSPSFFFYSVIAHPDTLQTALLVASLLFVFRYVDGGRLRTLVATSALAGVAFATKYAGAFLAPSVAAAVVVVAMRRNGRQARLRELKRRGTIAPLTFVAAFSLAHPGFFPRMHPYLWAIGNQSAWERYGMFFRETRGTLTWITLLMGPSGTGRVLTVVFIAFPLALLGLWWRRRLGKLPPGRLFAYAATASVGVLYLLMLLSGMRTFGPRYLFPCLPFVAAFSVAVLVEVANALPWRPARFAWLAAVVVWAAVAVRLRAPALAKAAAKRSADADSPRLAVGNWLLSHVPRNTPILYDYYTYMPEGMTHAVATWGLRPREVRRVRPVIVVTNGEIRNRYADASRATSVHVGPTVFLNVHREYAALAAGQLHGLRLVATFPGTDIRVYARGALADRLAPPAGGAGPPLKASPTGRDPGASPGPGRGARRTPRGAPASPPPKAGSAPDAG